VRNTSATRTGQFLVARLVFCVEELGLTGVSCSLIAERNVIELRWPHATLAIQESVEIPVDPRWIAEIIKILKTDASLKRRGQLVSLDTARSGSRRGACRSA
jgi:hypothetical protein